MAESTAAIDGPTIVSLDDIVHKLSLYDISLDHGEDFFSGLANALKHHIDRYDDDIHAHVKQLLSHDDESIRDENKLELITVFSVLRTIRQIDQLLLEPLNADTSRKVSSMLLSFVPLLKYHFQLPVTHNNYALRNFGSLLASRRSNLINPFIKFMSSSVAYLNESTKSETLEKAVALILTLHCFNQDMFNFLAASFKNTTMANDLFFNFNLKSKISSKTQPSIPSVFAVMQRFRMLILLEDSSLASDMKCTNLLLAVFHSSFHKHFLTEFITNILKVQEPFNSLSDTYKIDSSSLFPLAINILESSNSLDLFAMFLFHNPQLFGRIDDNVKSEYPSDKTVSDISMYLLLKASTNLYLNFNILPTTGEHFHSLLVEYNNHNYTSILGISASSNVSTLTISTLIPIFEFYDQNLKLNYLQERDFLTTLKLSLVNLDLNLDSIEDFMNLNSLLIDTGCATSIHALIDKIQMILTIVINKIKFGNGKSFNRIPKDFEALLDLAFIPPVYRSDMSFANNIDLQAPQFGSTFSNLQEIENHSQLIKSNSITLLEDCLTLMLAAKSKIYKFLKDLNMDTNVLRLPDLFTSETQLSSTSMSNTSSYQQDENPLNSFKQNISTKIASFKSNKSLNYKLLNSSISLNIVANLSLLVLSENYKALKSTDHFTDNSLSRLLSEFMYDYSLTFLIIYQEFGLLSFFKKIRELNQENLRLILPSAALVSKLFQTKSTEHNLSSPTTSNHNANTPSPTTSNFSTTATWIHSSNLELISEILYKSVIASNLLRQYVELFDDGQSKPFKSLNKFLKAHPSTLKPSKISKGTVLLDLEYYKQVLTSS